MSRFLWLREYCPLMVSESSCHALSSVLGWVTEQRGRGSMVERHGVRRKHSRIQEGRAEIPGNRCLAKRLGMGTKGQGHSGRITFNLETVVGCKTAVSRLNPVWLSLCLILHGLDGKRAEVGDIILHSFASL